MRQDELRDVLEYNPETGIFTWKVDMATKGSHGRKGTEAGCNLHGYRVITIKGKPYKAHRLAWFYVHGEWPTYCIDHINGEKADNRIENLRDVPPRVNSQNKRVHREGGVRGVTWYKPYSKWVVKLWFLGSCLHGGYYDDKEEAIEAYNNLWIKVAP